MASDVLLKFYNRLYQERGVTYPYEAYEYLLDTIILVTRTESLQGTEYKTTHMSPAKICSLLETRMAQDFGGYAAKVAKHWKILGSEDIGKMVFSLADYGHLKLDGSEKMADFVKAGFGVPQ